MTATASTIKVASGYRKVLTDLGYAPVAGCRKLVGAPTEWHHPNGQRARVGYNLLSRTGQRSMGAAATWGYVIAFEEGGRA